MTPEPRAPTTLDQEIIHAGDPRVLETQTDAQRLARVEAELRAGFEALADIGRRSASSGRPGPAPIIPTTPSPGGSAVPSARPVGR